MSGELDVTRDFAQRWPNLAQPRLGAEVAAASDEFFGARERLIDPEPPAFIPDRYDDHGKWVDGWETRRRRDSGLDWCVVRLGRPARIVGVDIDTSHFTGNYPMAASIEAGCDGAEWIEIVPATTLGGDAHHLLPIVTPGPWTQLRLHIYPDGGVARLRVYGQFVYIPGADAGGGLVELSGLLNGGRVVAWSDAHYGWPGKILLPDRGINMGDGWETRRRRTPGNEWLILELGCPGEIREVEIDTSHNKGNYPDRCSIQAAFVERATDESIVAQSMFWPALLPEQKLAAHCGRVFDTEVASIGTITHARVNIIPDGGVSRVRLYGTPA